MSDPPDDRGQNQERPPEDGCEALVRLWGHLGRAVCNFFLRRGCPREEARDLRSETFLRAVSGIESFRGDSELETWIFGIAKNLWSNRRRDGGRQKRRGLEVPLEGEGDLPGPADVEPAPEEDPFEEAARAEQVRLVHRALKDLPAVMRQCTLLRMDQEMAYHEIAAVLQISESQVKTNLFRARARLKGLLAPYASEMSSAEGAQ